MECKILNPQTTRRGITVVSLHYGLNPKYDEEWARKTRASMDPDKWNQEYEISYLTPDGQPVIHVEPAIHFRDIEPIAGKVLWRGWDFGYRAPACVVTQMNMKDQWCWYWAIVGENETTYNFGKRVMELCDAKFPPGKDDRSRTIEQLWLDFCDPHGVNATENADINSIDALQAAHQDRYRKRMSLRWARIKFEVGISLIRERLPLRNDGEPGILISNACELLKEGALGGYHFPDDRKSGEHPEFPAKDGHYIHPFDALRYIAVCNFKTHTPQAMNTKDWDALEQRLEHIHSSHHTDDPFQRFGINQLAGVD